MGTKRVQIGKISATEYGLQVSKIEADVTAGLGTADLLFDSRRHRVGIMYGGGNVSSASSAINFKGSKAELAYIPLIQYQENAVGEGEYDNVGGNEEEYFYQSRENFHIFTKTTITPAILSKPSSGGSMLQTGRSSFSACTNLNYRVLRIPCAYGYMTAANFSDVTTSSTKRVIIGKNTNSNHGFSNGSPGYGVFVSRPGKDVTTCSADELILNTDANQSGTSNVSKGMYQALQVRTVNNIPRADFQVTATSSGATVSLVNLYSHLGTVGGVDLGVPTLPTNNATAVGSGGTSGSTSTPNPSISYNATGTQVTFTTSTNQLFSSALMPTFSNLSAF